MSIANRLLSHVQDSPEAPAPRLTRGQWFNIRLHPNPLAGEQLNVGVGFVDQMGTLHTRLTEDLSRLHCLYDDRIDIDGMQALLAIASAEFNQARFEPSLTQAVSPQISFSNPSYAAGASVADILDTFFAQTVSLVSPKPKFSEYSLNVAAAQIKREHFRGYTNAAAIYELREWMGQHHSAIARRIFHHNPVFKIRSHDGGRSEEHAVELPLRYPGRLAGTIVSAYCSGVRTAQLRLLQSAMAINTAKRHLKDEKIGLFVLRPDLDSGIGTKTLNQFDDAIDESVWQLHDAGVYVGIETSVEALGREIVAWAA